VINLQQNATCLLAAGCSVYGYGCKTQAVKNRARREPQRETRAVDYVGTSRRPVEETETISGYSGAPSPTRMWLIISRRWEK
jgi:hypothetical protein